MEDLGGRQLGAYQIVAPLGEGGMAAVYRAYQPSMERQVAIKVLPRQYSNSPEYLARFKQEARLLARLQHPHILPVFDSGESDGYTFIVMPLVGGGTLAELMRNEPLSLARSVAIVSQIGDALDYAHANRLIHRDIKPSNILIDDRGNSLLMDFGIARMVEATTRLTQVGGVIGTPAYMSPEQGAGQTLDKRSDVYSLGIVLFEMLTGRVPYKAETPLAVLFKHVHDPLPLARKLVPTLPEAVEMALLKALAKKPEDRYQSMGEFVRALQSAVPATATGQPMSAERVTAAEATRMLPASDAPVAPTRSATTSSASRLPAQAVAGAAVLLAAVTGLFMMWRGQATAIPTLAANAAIVNATAEPALETATLSVADSPGPQPMVNATATLLATSPATPEPVATIAPTETQPRPTDVAATTPTPNNTQPETILAERFGGGSLDFDVWSRAGGGAVKLGGWLDLTSGEAAFPLVLSGNAIVPADGPVRLRFRMQHPTLNACGVGFHMTSTFPKVAASELEWLARRDDEARAGYTLSIWQDATHGLRAAFHGAGQSEERTLFGGDTTTQPHDIIVDRDSEHIVVRVDGQVVLNVRSPNLAGYVSFGHPAKIDSCAGYWSSMRVTNVDVVRLPPQADIDVGVNEQPREPIDSGTCRPRWFFSPSPEGCPLSARNRSMMSQRYERGSILHFPDTNQVFVFLENSVWRNINGITPEAAAAQNADQLGARTGAVERWRACGGHAEKGDEVTAYIVDAKQRILSWTVRKSNGQPLRWSYLEGARLLRCG